MVRQFDVHSVIIDILLLAQHWILTKYFDLTQWLNELTDFVLDSPWWSVWVVGFEALAMREGQCLFIDCSLIVSNSDIWYRNCNSLGMRQQKHSHYKLGTTDKPCRPCCSMPSTSRYNSTSSDQLEENPFTGPQLIKTCSVSCKRPCIKIMHITCVPVKNNPDTCYMY